jgi:hypothetical protein
MATQVSDLEVAGAFESFDLPICCSFDTTLQIIDRVINRALASRSFEFKTPAHGSTSGHQSSPQIEAPRKLRKHPRNLNHSPPQIWLVKHFAQDDQHSAPYVQQKGKRGGALRQEPRVYHQSLGQQNRTQ